MLIASQVWKKTYTVFVCFQNLHLHLCQAPIHLGRFKKKKKKQGLW